MSKPIQIFWPAQGSEEIINSTTPLAAGSLAFEQTAYELGASGLMPLAGGGLGGAWCFRNYQCELVMASSDDLSGVNFTITGTDVFGKPRSEVIAGPNTLTYTVNEYATVSSIVTSGPVTGQLVIGNGPVGRTIYIQPDYNRSFWGATLQLECDTNLTATVYGTIDPINPTHSPGDAGGSYNSYEDVTGHPLIVQPPAGPAVNDGFQQVAVDYPLTGIWCEITGGGQAGRTLTLTFLQQGLRS